jgi:hypothetical protein
MARRKPKGMYVTLRREPDGLWRVELRVHFTDGGTGFRVQGTDEGTMGGPLDAVKRAITTAKVIASNPAIASLLPPGTFTAIAAVDSIARAAAKGQLGRKLNGKAIHAQLEGALGKLAKTLHEATKDPQRDVEVSGLCLADGRPDNRWQR